MPQQIPFHVHRDMLDELYEPDDLIEMVVHVERWPEVIRIDHDLLRWEHPRHLASVGDRLTLTVDNGEAVYLLVARDERHGDWIDARLESSRLDRSTL